MSSNINPNNIDGTYPVAGQDNNSQGFRDNFTNTKTNFQYAADEITELQNKVVLKSALTGTVLDNNMNGSILSNAQLQNISETRVALGSLSGAVAVNYASGSYQTVTTNGSISLGFSNFTTAGTLSSVTVRITVSSTAHTVTLPAAVGSASAAASVTGIQGIASNIITFAETGTYEFVFHTDDSGYTIYLSELTRPRNRFINPLFLTGTGLVANASAISLSTTSSYFTTAATGETNTLAAGTAGQIKVLAYNAEANTSDTRIVTVSNAGWKASGTGTITFTEFGQTATLMYINSKWFVTGIGPGASDTFPTLA